MQFIQIENKTRNRTIYTDIFFCIFLAMSFLSERTVLGRVTLLLFVLSSFFLITRLDRFNFSSYFLLEIIFIGYSFFQNFFGVTVNTDYSSNIISTLMVSLIVYVCFYNYLLINNNLMRGIKLLVLSYFWSIVIMLTINVRTLFSARSGAGIDIAGINIGGVIAISTGWMAGICMVLSVIIYKRLDSKKFWAIVLVMIFALLTSGTRKAFLFTPLSIWGYFYVNQHKKNVIKSLLKIFAIVLISVAGYFIVLNIDILYETVGYRLENVVHYIISDGQAEVDASMLTRMSLVDRAHIAFLERPIWGWGLNNFRYAVNNGGTYSHNNFYEILVSGGWVGFLIYYSKYVFVFLRLRKAISMGEKNDIKILHLLMTLCCTLVLLEYWQITYYTRKFMIVWVLILAFANNVINTKKNSTTERPIIKNENFIRSPKISH